MSPKKKTYGNTWWGACWIGALEALGAQWYNRLPRGRSYARRGNVLDLFVRPGEVYALVKGSRPKAYVVRIRLPALTDDVWDAVMLTLTTRASYVARLLAGEMPDDIEDAFEEAGASLFPRRARELRTRCDCPDAANPCKHVAAVHYVLAEALDADPWLLFEIRGRTKDDVLAELRRRRSPSEAPAQKRKRQRRSVADKPAAFDEPRTPLPYMRFAPKGPEAAGALIRSLGAPASWRDEASPEEVFGPIVAAASRRALELALQEDKQR